MGKRISLERALATARANNFAQMLGRAKDNRTEPECWPHVNPSFHFDKNQKLFAIGSCFAQNLSRRLVLDGFNVHGGADLEGDRRNRYTPPAIFQELNWAWKISQRDGQPRESDIAPLLLQISKDRWTDLWCRPEKGPSLRYEEAVASRIALYEYFKGAFESDVVIITLGLIEAWWDEVSRSYVEFDPPLARRSDRDRFRFERLSFQRCRDFVDRTLQLLLNGQRRVLITTSPVVLGRTFTDEDIIVANTHSKAVLRGVAGELASEYEHVDYFPSYEIATITRRPEVWEDDLLHVRPNFVGRIMQHVTNAYLPGSGGTEAQALLQMANLVEASQFDAAQLLYDELKDVVWVSRDPAVHVAAMRLATQKGDQGRALRHALEIDAEEQTLYSNHPEWMFDVSRVLRSSEEHQLLGGTIRDRLFGYCAKRPELLMRVFVDRERANDDAAVREVIDFISNSDIDHPVLMHKVLAKMHQLHQVEDALVLLDRQLGKSPNHPLMLARRARLMLTMGRLADAAMCLERLREIEPENTWAHLTLGRTLLKANRLNAALEAVDKLLAEVADEAPGLDLKARILSRLGRMEEALAVATHAKASAAADPGIIRQC